MIGRGNILANVDNCLAAPQSSCHMLPTRYPPDQTVLASVEGDHDLGGAFCAPKHLQNFDNSMQTGNVVEAGDDGEVAHRDDLVGPMEPSRRQVHDHEIISH